MSLLQENDGKTSFGRTFGAIFVLSVLVGWFLVGFGVWAEMPAGTQTIMAFGVGGTYGISKIGSVIQKKEKAT